MRLPDYVAGHKTKNSFVFLSLPVLLKDSVLVMQAIEVSFGHNLLSAGKDGNTNDVTGWDGLDCLDIVRLVETTCRLEELLEVIDPG